MPIQTQILYGDIVATTIRSKVQIETAEFIRKYGRSPHIAVILSYPNQASEIYVRKKIEACQEVGMQSTLYSKPCHCENELLDIIDTLNNDRNIDAILVQFPLHPSINVQKITQAIDPFKDVDGFSPINLGKLVQGKRDGLIPCTPKGIVQLLHYYAIPISGKNIAVIGRSLIVGTPISLLLSSPIENGTVTILHSQSSHMKEHLKQANIIISATGKPNLIDKSMIQDGVVIVDVGINRILLDSGKSKIVGDVDFASVFGTAAAITPVPKGVGPMTVACLLENALICAYFQVEAYQR